MKKSINQAGFSHILIVLAIVAIGVVGFVGWRVMSGQQKHASNTEHETKTAQVSEPDIQLQNIGLASLDSVLVSTNATREFKSQGLKGFYVFGDKLSGGRLNPNFEFASLKEGTKVISAIDGVVAFIKEQGNEDFEVFVQPKEGSMWTIGYDHIAKVAVKKGDPIKVGAVIGEPAMQNNGLTRFEIQINKDQNGQTTHICPTTLLAAGVKNDIVNGLTTMQNNWEKTTGLELYDVSAQNPVGCLMTTLTPQQAEGR